MESKDLKLYVNDNCILNVDDDDKAIYAFLNRVTASGEQYYSGTTKNNYLRDIRRLNMWRAKESLSLRELNYQNILEFNRWLMNPDESLITQVKGRRWPYGHKHWKPFYLSGLGPKAMKQQTATCKALFGFLCVAGYLHRNPFALVANSKRSEKSNDRKPARHLFQEDIQLITRYMSGQSHLHQNKGSDMSDPNYRRYIRHRWVWMAFSLTGLRISELINLNTGNVYQHEMATGQYCWMMDVKGKGKSDLEQVIIPDLFVEEMKRYRKALGKTPMALKTEAMIYDLSGSKPIISRQSAHTILKGLVYEVADIVQAQRNYPSAVRLREASTHWLRHGFVTKFLESSNNDMKLTQMVARHSDFNTTASYAHKERPLIVETLNSMAESLKID